MVELVKRRSSGAALLLGLVFLLGAGAAPAQACDASNQKVFGISPGCVDLRISAAPTVANLAPDFFQAGGHPHEVVTTIRFNAPSEPDPVHGAYWPPESLRDMSLSLPTGLTADLSSIPTCSLAQLRVAGAGESPICPTDSQVGLVTLTATIFSFETLEVPLYLVEPEPGVVARFGFGFAGTTSVLDARVESGGELSIRASQMSQFLALGGLRVVLWGVPADPIHDPQRACPGLGPPTPGLLGASGPSCPSTVPPRVFLRLPTSCAAPGTTAIRVSSWENPAAAQSRSVAVHRSPGLLGDPATPGSYPAPYPGLAANQWGPEQSFTGCGQLPFDPEMSVRPGSQAADSPTGLDVEVSFPQQGFSDPDAVSESDMESGTFTLPAGLSLNPAVANGLSGCKPEEIDLDSSDPARCPDSSKLGTVELTTPIFSKPLTGSIYSAEADKSTPGKTRLPTYIVAGSDGLTLKFVAELSVDEGDGRLTASFADLPGVPLSRLSFDFFGGQRAPFVTPAVCGSYLTTGEFVPLSGTAAVSLSDGFEITSGPGGAACPNSPGERPFDPGFRVATDNSIAGAETAIAIQLTRRDGEQEPRSLDVDLPPGLSASIDGVATCPDAAIAAASGREGAAEAAAPSCPATAQIGEASATIGAGAEPFHLKGGRTYLAGPYQGSEFSFALVLPAVAGPMDLGTLTTRLPLRVDPDDGHLTLAGELPSQHNGTRLNLKQLTIDVDRPGFLTNPTNCRASEVGGRVDGDAGATRRVSAPFQTTRCGSLGFKPRLRMKVLGGRSAARHRAHPSLRSVLSTRPGDANFEQAVITLPGSAQLDPSQLGSVCKRAELRREACPPDSVSGRVTVKSRMFSEPLSGPVYLRQSTGRLPSLVAVLRGKVDLNLEMKLGFADGRMQIAIDSLPDIPIERLTLTTTGGRRGLFVNNRNLCEGPSFALAELIGQNDRLAKRRAKLGAPCAAAKKNVTGSDD